jgi:hypothetical protein
MTARNRCSRGNELVYGECLNPRHQGLRLYLPKPSPVHQRVAMSAMPKVSALAVVSWLAKLNTNMLPYTSCSVRPV